VTKERILDKLAKMQAARDGEAKLGNMEASEAFAAAINRMLLEHQLTEDQIPGTDDPVVEVMVDLRKWGIDRSRTRIDWQERLAGIVARYNLCQFLVCKGSNLIWFVGTRSHTAVAEYIYGMLVPAAERMAVSERRKHWIATGKLRGKANPTLGYREAWLNAFVQRIAERLRAMREEVVQATGDSSTALVRLNQSVVKVNDYMLAKQTKKVSALGGAVRHNAAGAAHGKAAADRMPIDRKGLTS
jgi:hypothetical protein